MKKRLFIVFLAAIIAFAGLPAINVSAGIYDDIEVSYDVNESRILDGDNFTLYFTIDEVRAGEISDVEINIETGSNFKVLGGNLNIPAAVLDKQYNVNLQYLGGSNSLPIKIKYDKNSV